MRDETDETHKLLYYNMSHEAPPADTAKFDYFLSHKKAHSRDGLVPRQIAKNLHDSLCLLGHSGWFDVDHLERITKEDLTAAIRQSASLIVLLNDETTDSDWCLHEWACAQQCNLPVKVIVDMERCSKKTALAILNTAHKHSASQSPTHQHHADSAHTLAESTPPSACSAPVSTPRVHREAPPRLLG
jgi:hypothetical protein